MTPKIVPAQSSREKEKEEADILAAIEASKQSVAEDLQRRQMDIKHYTEEQIKRQVSQSSATNDMINHIGNDAELAEELQESLDMAKTNLGKLQAHTPSPTVSPKLVPRPIPNPIIYNFDQIDELDGSHWYSEKGTEVLDDEHYALALANGEGQDQAALLKIFEENANKSKQLKPKQ